VAVLSLFALAVLLPGASSPSQITRGDVYNFVLRVVVGFLDKGQWLVPHMGPVPDFSKPPLFHWLLAGSIRLLPDPFVAVRLPPALCSGATAALTYAFGRKLGLDQAKSLAASLLWLGCASVIGYGRQPLLEAPLALAIIAAFYSIVRACDEGSAAWLYSAAVCLGLSNMIKWLQGPAMILPFAAMYAAGTGAWRTWARKPWAVAAAAALAFAVAAPWPVYIALRHGAGFFTQLGSESVGQRFSQTTTIVDFILHGVVISALPWTFLLLPAAAGARRLDRRTRWTLGCWLAAVFLPCLAITARTSRYSYPVAPALFLAIAAAWRPEKGAWRAASAATSALLLVMFSLAFCFCVRLQVLPLSLAVIGAAFGAAAATLLLSRRLAPAAACSCLASSILAGPAVSGLGMNAIPPRIVSEIGGMPVTRVETGPEDASTGYLPLYLMRDVEILLPRPAVERKGADSLFVTSGSGLDQLAEEAARSGYRVRVIDSWDSPHTNPLPERIVSALKRSSTEPLNVRHSLVALERAVQ
jgi:4-amino-4-deoxy-L-arabinose transferase-like glycosyltransferase